MLENYLTEQKRDSVFDDTSDDSNSDYDNEESDYENYGAEVALRNYNSDANQESTDNESDVELGHCSVCSHPGELGSKCYCTEDNGALFI